MADITQGDANVKQSIDVQTRVNKRFVSKMPINAVVLKVADLEHIITNNAIATTVTNMTGGRDGQPLNILANDANTTLANNANIVTSTDANKLLVQCRVYRLHYY